MSSLNSYAWRLDIIWSDVFLFLLSRFKRSRRRMRCTCNFSTAVALKVVRDFIKDVSALRRINVTFFRFFPSLKHMRLWNPQYGFFDGLESVSGGCYGPWFSAENYCFMCPHDLCCTFEFFWVGGTMVIMDMLKSLDLMSKKKGIWSDVKKTSSFEHFTIFDT